MSLKFVLYFKQIAGIRNYIDTEATGAENSKQNREL